MNSRLVSFAKNMIIEHCPSMFPTQVKIQRYHCIMVHKPAQITLLVSVVYAQSHIDSYNSSFNKCTFIVF